MVKKFILIGASTGGPGRLHTILEELPHNFCSAIIIAQHMVPLFIPSFVKQLSVSTSLEIQAVYDGIEILPSNVYVCSGECKLIEKEGRLCVVYAEPPELLYSPNVDTLFLSAAELSRSIEKMGIILTGIGDDGAKGSKALFDAGGVCMFESEESATVYGMPRCAIELVPQGKVGSMSQIIEAILDFGEKCV